MSGFGNSLLGLRVHIPVTSTRDFVHFYCDFLDCFHRVTGNSTDPAAIGMGDRGHIQLVGHKSREKPMLDITFSERRIQPRMDRLRNRRLEGLPDPEIGPWWDAPVGNFCGMTDPDGRKVTFFEPHPSPVTFHTARSPFDIMLTIQVPDIQPWVTFLCGSLGWFSLNDIADQNTQQRLMEVSIPGRPGVSLRLVENRSMELRPLKLDALVLDAYYLHPRIRDTCDPNAITFSDTIANNDIYEFGLKTTFGADLRITSKRGSSDLDW